MSKAVGDVWYRFVDVQTTGGVSVTVHEWEIMKITPRGVWLQERFGSFLASTRRFVLDDSKRRFACPTVELARESFIARKQRQAGIYEARRRRAIEAMRQACLHPRISRNHCEACGGLAFTLRPPLISL